MEFFSASLGEFRQKSLAPPKICLLLRLWVSHIACSSVQGNLILHLLTERSVFCLKLSQQKNRQLIICWWIDFSASN